MAGTRWVKLDLDYFTNPKVRAAGPRAAELHLASICYSATHLTDGHISVEVCRNLCRSLGANYRTVSRVIEAGLWEPNGDGGYTIHDYLVHQRSRSQVEKDRADAAERQRRHRDSG